MELESKNNAHEAFWRQMLRYLVSTTPGPVEAASERDVYATGDPVNLHAEVDDKKYEPVKDAQVTARITKPSGATVEVPMQFNFGEEANDYRGEYTPDEKGVYRIDLTAKRANTDLGTSSSSFLVTELAQVHDAAQNVELLKRIAAETGGQYHPLNKANDLIDELTYLGGNNPERLSLELWDMPINFLLLVALVSADGF